MRTFTIEHTVYTFDELSEQAKEKAREWYREGDKMEWLSDDIDYRLDELLKENGIKPIDIQVHCSLSYCQGDGASFTGDIEWKSWRASIIKNFYGNWYAHSKTVSVDECTSLKTDKDAPQATCDELQQIVENIGDELARYGYGCIEAAQSNENIDDMLQANEYEFYADGRIA